NGLAGVRVHIDGNGNGKYDPGENFVMTNPAGNYFLSAPANGTITVRVDPPQDRVATLAAAGSRSVQLSAAASRYGRNVGLRPITTPAQTIGGFGGSVFLDHNGNNMWEPGETGVAGRRVYLDLDNSGDWSANEPSVLT